MKRDRWLSGLLMGFLAVVGAEASASIRLSFSDADGLAPTKDAGVMRREVERLLFDAGVPMEWSERIEAAGRASALDVTIVLTPSTPGAAGWPLDPSAMGAYLISGGSSAVFVFSPRIRSALGLPAPGQRLLRPRERRDLARAIARVAVHELVHRLEPSLPHAASGVMQSRLDRRALTGDQLRLDEMSRMALSRVVEVAWQPTEAPSPRAERR